jgi:3-methyl-2-oxobutanoate hydroxymethyltransferase
VKIPTIGIGAGPDCDGQVLVSYDMLGLSGDAVPPFVKTYARVGESIGAAARAYVAEVRAGTFPSTGVTTSAPAGRPDER